MKIKLDKDLSDKIDCLGEKLDRLNKILAIATAERLSNNDQMTTNLINSLYKDLDVGITRTEKD